MMAEDAAFSGDEFAFSEISVRHAFIKKVYGILTVQLIVTFGIVAIFTFVDPVNEYIRQNNWVFWVSFICSLTLLIALSCAGELRRKTPQNFIFLIIFTIFEGFFLGSICAWVGKWEVSIAVVATLVVTAGLTLFAFQTKIDFTMKAGALTSLLLVLLIFGLFALLFNSSVMTLLYACLGALVFSLYIVFDTQLIIGGKHKYSISPEEYIFAALNLYLDVINLFVMLLTIISGSRN